MSDNEVGLIDSSSASSPVPTYALRRRVHKNLNEDALSAFKDQGSDSEPEFKPKQTKLTSPATTTLASISSDSSSVTHAHDSSSSEELSFPCSKCNKIFSRKRYLQKHVKFFHALKKASVKCELCSKPLYNREVLKRHMETVHNSNPVPKKSEFEQKCNKCLLHFKDQKSLKHHYCNSNSESPPTLKQFPMIVIEEGQNSSHLNPSTQPDRFTCKHCSKSYAGSDGLKRHMQIHTGKPSKCSICSKTFNLIASLKAHMSRRHPKAESTKLEKTGCTNTNQKSLKCQYCSMTFSFKHCLQIHERKHTGAMPFGCPICPKRFNDPAEVKYHVMRHTGEKPFKCTEPGCEQAYRRGSHLTQHMRIHTGELPYSCRACPERFKTSTHRLRHEKKFHPFLKSPHSHKAGEGEQPSSAATTPEYPGMNFVAAPNQIADSKRTSSRALSMKKPGQKRKKGQFSCRFCGRTFGKNSHCKRHECTVHKEEEPQTNLKEISAAEFTRKDDQNQLITPTVNSVVEELNKMSQECQKNRVMLNEIIVKDENEELQLDDDDGTSIVLKQEDSITEPILTISSNAQVVVQPPPVYCPYCYISVQNNVDLEEHGRISHAAHTGNESDMPMFTCPHLYCGSKLTSILELKLHQRIIHKLKDI